MSRRKPLLAAVFIPILIGCIGITTLSQRPRFELFHTVDILQLLASGMCFGMALAALFVLLKSSESR